METENVFFSTECQTVLYFCTVADTLYTLELRSLLLYLLLGVKSFSKKVFQHINFDFFLPQNSEPARSLNFKSANPEKTSPLNSAGQNFTGPISIL